MNQQCGTMIGEFAALGAALSWVVSAVLYKQALAEVKPISANIFRLASTSIVLVLFITVVGKLSVLSTLPFEAVVLACASGVVGLGLGDTCYMISLKLIGVSRAVPLTCIYPLFSILWAISLKGEQVNPSIVFGAVIIVSGIWLVSKQEKESLQNVKKEVLVRGVVFALATALFWSVSISMIDLAVTLPATSTLDHALAINTIRIIAIATVLVVFSPILDRKMEFLRMNRRVAGKLLVGGAVALGLGWFFLAFSLLSTSEALAVPISSTTPFFSTLSGVVFLHESVNKKTVVGSIMVVAGIFVLFMMNSA